MRIALPAFAEFVDHVFRFKLQPGPSFQPLIEKLGPAVKDLFFDENGRPVPIDHGSLVHQVAILTAEALEPLWKPIGAYMAGETEIGQALHRQVAAGTLLGALLACTGEAGSKRMFRRWCTGSATMRMMDYESVVLRRASTLRRKRGTMEGEGPIGEVVDFVSDLFARHIEAIATGRADQTPAGLDYLVPPDAAHRDVVTYGREISERPPAPSPTVPAVVTGLPKMRIGGDMITLVLIDGVEAVHADEALAFMGLRSTKFRINKIRNDGSFSEGNGYYTIPHPDGRGQIRPTTFITLLALTTFAIRSHQAKVLGSKANTFANGLLARMSQNRAAHAERLIEGFAPAVEHLTRSAARLVARKDGRLKSLAQDAETLRGQLAAALKELDEARETAGIAARRTREAENELRDGAEKVRKAERERDEAEAARDEAEQSRAKWQAEAELGSLRIIELEDQARLDRDDRYDRLRKM